jgi:hypothetical protein
MAPIITLLTDFGLQDGYVASLKGVILGICPTARLVDITHQVPAQNVSAAAYLLAGTCRDFPAGTIHLAVVDPGVGTPRRALAIRTSRYFFVGPDNGLFAWVLQDQTEVQSISLENPRFWRSTVSSTFHGRDLFAPVAAHLARGTALEEFGPPCGPLTLPCRSARRDPHGLHGEIIYIDHFGNAISNITRQDLAAGEALGKCSVQVAEQHLVPLVNTYAEAAPGTAVALIGSGGHLEIAVNRGDAAERLGLRPGSRIFLSRTPRPAS